MGVYIQLGGMSDFANYLDTEVENADLDDEKRLEYEEKYDGYQMLWLFDTSAVTDTADGAIDAACISSNYANGGFCAGIKFVGTTTRSEEKWAIWAH